tara:strand:+ start:280 stop:429 length:150 start_codon:yes stop_codon:yes gene_type:complete
MDGWAVAQLIILSIGVDLVLIKLIVDLVKKYEGELHKIEGQLRKCEKGE